MAGGAARCGDRVLDSLPDRRRAGEFVIGNAGALPGQRPASRSATDIIGAIPRDQNMALRAKRQNLVIILDQNQRLAHRFPCQRAMIRAAQQVIASGIGATRRASGFEQSGADLDSQNIGDSIIEPGHRHGAVFRLLYQAMI